MCTEACHLESVLASFLDCVGSLTRSSFAGWRHSSMATFRRHNLAGGGGVGGTGCDHW
eukprot:gene10712-biopygen8678